MIVSEWGRRALYEQVCVGAGLLPPAVNLCAFTMHILLAYLLYADGETLLHPTEG